MSDQSSIEWTDATWNPVTGCTEVSPGCDNCYARTLAERFRNTPGHYYEHGFDVVLRPEKLEMPMRWRKPRRVFVNSMSDLFHDAVPDDYIARVWAVMATSAAHTFQVLTKRHARMRALLNSPEFREDVETHWCDLMRRPPGRWQHLFGTWPLPNVWLGVSVEDQKWADIRIPALLDTPAAVRFLSCEPLLGPVTLKWFCDCGCGLPVDQARREASAAPRHLNRDQVEAAAEARLGIDWVIVGGESGRGARPMSLEWVRDLRDQCDFAGVAFYFKQAGTILARRWGSNGKGGNPADWPEPFPRQYPRPGRPGFEDESSSRPSA